MSNICYERSFDITTVKYGVLKTYSITKPVSQKKKNEDTDMETNKEKKSRLWR